jgi:uncharacterized delta-60 repeat protein
MFRTIFKKTLKEQIIILFLAALTIFGASRQIFAQFTFIGDYDRTNFAAPNGYYVEPQNNYPVDTTTPNHRTYLFTGELNPDGSIIAGGRIEKSSGGDFWLRKFTASGAVDASFGGMGYVRTVFSTDFSGNEGNSLPTVLKRQSDGKIVFGGVCDVRRDQSNSTANTDFGVDWCLVRYNADGSIDNGFGNNIVQWSNGPNITYSQAVGAGRVATQTNIRESGLLGGAGLNAQLSDMAIQPDGKIIAVGYTRSEVNPYFQGVGTFRIEGIIIRYNANGTIDTTFGLNGIARFIPPNTRTTDNPCYPQRAFYGVRLQSDGRIIAVGYDGTSDAGCNTGNVFVVTRWNANGTLETVRRLDASTNIFAREKAVAALITNDGSKLLVSGQYQGNEALARLNLSDLSVDTSFGTNGVVNYNLGNQALSIKAIQTDGKILAVDPAFGGGEPVRFNPNGSPDNSFGNSNLDGSNLRGRLRLTANTFNTTNAPIAVSHLLLRPSGKFNLIGNGTANEGGNSPRALVSQNINVLRPNNTSDLTNDGKAEISVFRPSTGVWHLLNSSSGAYSAFNWGTSGDKIAPADFDGDGKSDACVFRNGTWYIFQSSNNQVRIVNFGLANDLPRPGDFDGDGYADIAVFRPASGVWYWINSSNNQVSIVQFGQNGDAPLIADFDGDGKSDISIFRSGVWYFIRSSNGSIGIVQFGLSGDIPTPGDYDGDGKSDLAVFRSGVWYVHRSSDDGTTILGWGQAGDTPVAADYDNDGKNDFAIYRSGVWWIYYTGTGSYAVASFGLATDTPLQSAYLP